MTPEHARREALLSLGGLEALKEAHRAQSSVPFLDMAANQDQLGKKMKDLLNPKGIITLTVPVYDTPAGALVPIALKHIRKGGTLAINAIHTSPIPQMDYQLIYGERTVRSVANATRRDAQEFMSIAAQIPIKTAVQTFPLDQANEVLKMLKASQVNGAAVLLNSVES